MQANPSLSRQRLFAIGLLVLFAGLAYSNSFGVPFYFDDYGSIIGNPAVQQGLNWQVLWEFSPARIITYATLAMNYSFGGLNTAGYHILNLFIHISSGIVVYFLARRLAALSQADDAEAPHWIGLAAALLFTLHPLQTQAVTYIVQRAALLTALFYLLALLAYVEARLRRQPLWLLPAALAGAAALLSKQNAATLPLAVLLLELTVLPAGRYNRKIAAALLVAALLATVAALAVPELADRLRETRDVSRLDYFRAQGLALCIYIGKFFFPIGLRLEYGIQPIKDFNAIVIFCWLAHIAALAAAMLLRKILPLLSFALLFYYLAHLVESSIFPIRDLVFEHRSYLPNFGLALAIAFLAWRFLASRLAEKGRLALWLIPALLLTGMSFARNGEWRDPFTFYQRNAELAPQASRVWLALSEEYVKRGDPEKALRLLQNAVQQEQGADGTRLTLSLDTAAQLARIFILLDDLSQALSVLDQALASNNPDFPLALQVDMLGNRAIIRTRLGDLDAAVQDWESLLYLNPRHTLALSRLADIEAARGQRERAIEHYRRALALDPAFEPARRGLAALTPP